jgi:surface polysaccharide O-acyltransferase-like enzyme
MKDWPNLTRFFAILLVIVLHVSAEISVAFGDVTTEVWLISIFYNSFSRCSVPLFIMLTGALILSKDLPLKEYLNKRFTRIFWPWLFWSLVFICLTIYSVFRKNESPNLYTIIDIVEKGLTNGASYHLWYIYMLLGLILFMPILRGWIKQAKDIDLVYFLVIWFLVISLKWAGVSLLSYHLFYFSEYIGYLVLGYTIANNRIPSFLKTKTALFITVISLIFTFLSTVTFSIMTEVFVEKYFEYLAPNVVIYSAGVFYLIKNCGMDISNRFKILINPISDLSFGIYFIHVLLIYFVFKFVHPRDFYVLISIPFLSMLILIFSLFIVKLLRLLPYGKKIIG